MKTTLSVCLALLAVTSASAQVFRPRAVNGAVPGGVAGANAASHGRTQVGVSHGGYIYRNAPAVQVSVGYGRGYYGGRGYYDRDYRGGVGFGYGYAVPSYGYYSGYGYGYPYYGDFGYYGSGSAAASGLWLGALAGGIIGHNSGDFRHNGWRGAAWGAGAGWLLGSIIDANRPAIAYQSAPPVVYQAPTAAAQSAAQPAPQQVTIINNYYNTSTPMSSANGMFGR